MHKLPNSEKPDHEYGRVNVVCDLLYINDNMSFKELKTIGNYALGRTIGEGTFGLVKLGVHQLTKE